MTVCYWKTKVDPTTQAAASDGNLDHAISASELKAKQEVMNEEAEILYMLRCLYQYCTTYWFVNPDGQNVP